MIIVFAFALHLVAWDTLVHKVINELALNGARHATIFTALIGDNFLQSNLLPVCCHRC